MVIGRLAFLWPQRWCAADTAQASLMPDITCRAGSVQTLLSYSINVPTVLPLHPPNRRLYAKPLAAAFEKRPDLRVTICHALRRLCTQNRAALAAADQPVGHADPCAVMSGGGGDEDGLAASQEEQVGGAQGDMAAGTAAVRGAHSGLSVAGVHKQQQACDC